jgi:hypothetical protein
MKARIQKEYGFDTRPGEVNNLAPAGDGGPD